MGGLGAASDPFGRGLFLFREGVTKWGVLGRAAEARVCLGRPAYVSARATCLVKGSVGMCL